MKKNLKISRTTYIDYLLNSLAHLLPLPPIAKIKVQGVIGGVLSLTLKLATT